MKHAGRVAVVLVLAACPKRVTEPTDGSVSLESPTVRETEPMRATVPSPGTWRGAGLSVDIPAGWTGREGRGSGLLLALQRPDGVAVELWSFEASENIPFPRERGGCEPLFSDRSTYRSLPGLPISATASCVPLDPAGVVVDGWYAEVDGRQLHIDVLLPSDRVIEGREAVAPMLASIRVLSEAP